MTVDPVFFRGCNRLIKAVGPFCWDSSEYIWLQKLVTGEMTRALQIGSQGQLRKLEDKDSPNSGWSFSPHQPADQ